MIRAMFHVLVFLAPFLVCSRRAPRKRKKKLPIGDHLNACVIESSTGMLRSATLAPALRQIQAPACSKAERWPPNTSKRRQKARPADAKGQGRRWLKRAYFSVRAGRVHTQVQSTSQCSAARAGVLPFCLPVSSVSLRVPAPGLRLRLSALPFEVLMSPMVLLVVPAASPAFTSSLRPAQP